MALRRYSPRMDWNDADQREAFFAVHSDLPREGPGNAASTHRALDLAVAAGAEPVGTVVDFGSGPGEHSRLIAERLPEAAVLAVDLHPPFLCRAGQQNHRMLPLRADMARPPLREGRVDLVWSEAAIYSIGVERALDAWAPLLRSGGVVAFSECVWLTRAPSARAKEFWTAYPGMRHRDDWSAAFEQRALEEVSRFLLPREAWWDGYYAPLEERLERLEVERAGNAAAALVFAECREEIAFWRAEGSDPERASYGYSFYILRKR